jgi:hypothetical protein
MLDKSAATTDLASTRLLTTFEGIEALTVSTGSGDDTLSLLEAPGPEVASLTLSTGDGYDLVVLQDLSAVTFVDLGAGDDEAQLRADITNAHIEIEGNSGDDTIRILRVGESTAVEVFGGPGRDLVRLSGSNLPASATISLHGEEPNEVAPDEGDTLVFDPQNLDYLPEVPTAPDGTIGVVGQAVVSYDTIEAARVIAAPVIEFAGTPYEIHEGDGMTLQVNVTPLGTTNALREEVIWDLDADGRFVEASGQAIILTWAQLVDIGIADDGTFQLGVSATNEDGFTAESFVSFTILNTPPTISVTGESEQRLGSPFELQFSAADPGADRVFEWRVDWGDGTSEVFGSGSAAATHLYGEPGSVLVQVGAVDEDSWPGASIFASGRHGRVSADD